MTAGPYSSLTLSFMLHGGGDGRRDDVPPPSAVEELSDSVLGVGEILLGVWGLGCCGGVLGNKPP